MTLYAGLMSGTSMDGVDAVLAEINGSRFVSVRSHTSRPYAPDIRAGLMRLALDAPAIGLSDLADLDVAVADCFADTVKQLLDQTSVGAEDIRALGSHGQTVFHRPGGTAPTSLQLGDPSRIAARSGITTVADFRRRDIAEGGQGAPLVPAFHHAVFAQASESRCVANIGGIANVTLLPDAGRDGVRGFDTGPGNGLMDEWAQRNLNVPHDSGGQWAAGGRLLPTLLDVLLADPYFRAPAPKSSGRDYFNLAWARQRCPTLEALPAQDVQRTFCELTAITIAAAASEYAVRRVLICGGGSANLFLMQRLGACFQGVVECTDAHGLDAMHVEAAAFAWLAMCRLDGLAGNLPAVTGAHRDAVLGGVYAA